jgi:hypothetical protein
LQRQHGVNGGLIGRRHRGLPTFQYAQLMVLAYGKGTITFHLPLMVLKVGTP